MAEIHAASRRDMETTLLLDASNGELDRDDIDAMLEAAREYWDDSVGDTIAAFNQVMEREGICPAE